VGVEDSARWHRKIVKDVVHQFVELPADFFDTCIDALLVQRLRDVRQLSLAHFVYPGAVHSRFEHSLGVAHAMRRALSSVRRTLRETVTPLLAKRLEGTPHSKVIPAFLRKLEGYLGELEGEAVTAALLHDIGHIALSHAAEEAFKDRILDFTRFKNKTTHPTLRLDHEEVTLEVAANLASLYSETLKNNVDASSCKSPGEPCVRVCYGGRRVNMKIVYEILEYAYGRRDPLDSACRPLEYSVTLNGVQEVIDTKNQPIEDVIENAAWTGAKCIIAKLLNHSIDVDRADYILRDSIHSGSIAGIYDITRFYSVITVVPRIIGNWRDAKGRVRVEVDLGVLDKGVTVVENMLLSRIYMYNDVYLHDISMIYSAMASRLLAILYITVLALYEEASEYPPLHELIDKYPFLKALNILASTFRGREASRTRSGEYDARKALDALMRALTLASDHGFEYMVKEIALGYADPLLKALADYYKLEPGEDAKKVEGLSKWFKSACLAAHLLAWGLSNRRHWSALILDESERTPRIISGLKSEEFQFTQEVKKALTPLVVLSYASYHAYDPSKSRNRIFVFRRSTPEVPEEITRVSHARVVRKIAGEHYSKVLILSPLLYRAEAPDAWRLRRGKVSESNVKDVARKCGLEPEEGLGLAIESAERAASLARTLWSLV